MLNREAHLDLGSAIEAEALAQAECLRSEAFRTAARRHGRG
jgi:hypothetical protein